MSAEKKNRLEKSLTKIANTLISKAEGYVGSNHLLHDLRLDYNINGHQLASQFGFNSFEQFMNSDLMKKHVKVEGEGDNLVYKPAYNPCLQHILEEMLKSRSDVLKRKEIKEKREAAKNGINNGYPNNCSSNLKPQNGFNNRSGLSSGLVEQMAGGRQAQLEPQTRQNKPQSMMSIKEMHRNIKQNDIAAVRPHPPVVDSTQSGFFTARRGVNTEEGPLKMPYVQMGSPEEFDPCLLSEKVDLVADKNRKCSYDSNGFKVYNPPINSSFASFPSSNTPTQPISKIINWNLDEDDVDETDLTVQVEVKPKPILQPAKTPIQHTRKNSSSDEWDFGELDVSSPTIQKAVSPEAASSKSVATAPHSSYNFFGSRYHRKNTMEEEPKIISTPTSQTRALRPVLPAVVPRNIIKTDSFPVRRTFQRAPDTSPPTSFLSRPSTVRVPTVSERDPLRWLGDLDKKNQEEERHRMVTGKFVHAFPSGANLDLFVRGRGESSNSFTSVPNTSSRIRSLPGLGNAVAVNRNFPNRPLARRNSHFGYTSYNGTGYRTKEEYDNRLELSDSD